MVQPLPGFLNLSLNVCSPCQVLGDVYTEVLEAAHPLHRGPTDHKRSVGLLLSLPEVHDQLLGFAKELQLQLQLQLNLAKTEFLVFPATPTLQHYFTIQLGSSTITPSASVRNLGVIFDDQLTFKEHIAKTARSCRFALHNIRKIRPFLTEHAAQLLVQALVISRLD